MKTTAAVLALLVGALSATPFLARPASPRAAHPDRAHECCCATCPGPGLCPCDSRSSRENACVKAADERPSSVETPSAPAPLKLTCDPYGVPRLPESGERRAESERAPHPPIPVHPPEKVPISVA